MARTASWGAMIGKVRLDPEADNVYSGLIRFPDREEVSVRCSGS